MSACDTWDESSEREVIGFDIFCGEDGTLPMRDCEQDLNVNPEILNNAVESVLAAGELKMIPGRSRWGCLLAKVEERALRRPTVDFESAVEVCSEASSTSDSGRELSEELTEGRRFSVVDWIVGSGPLPTFTGRGSIHSMASAKSTVSMADQLTNWAHVISLRFQLKMPLRNVMRTEIEVELLRGVRLERALHRCGARWFRGSGTTEDYELSEATKELEWFISHDWFTGRWPKFIALAMTMNGRLALVTSTLVGVVLALVHRSAPLHIRPPSTQVLAGEAQDVAHGAWAMLLCPLTFVISMFFGQRLLALVPRRRRLAFVDKFCIHQTDVDRKAAGIESLAGFLSNTRCLLVLWSPHYLTRLWCTYELASWFHLQKAHRRSVLFVPVALPMLTVYLCVGMIIFVEVNHFSLGYGNAAWKFCRPLLLCALVLILPVRFMSCFVRDLQVLPEQLAHFSIRKTRCFCCDHEHKHPVTWTEIQCDRQLVYRTLEDWYRQDTHDTDLGKRCLDTFDHKVQCDLAQWVLREVGDGRVPYLYALIVACPFVWSACDTAASVYALDVQSSVRLMAHHGVLAVAVVPLLAPLCLQVLTLGERFFGAREGKTQEFLTLVYVLVITAVSGAVWSVLEISTKFSFVWLQVVLDSVIVLFALWIFVKRPNPDNNIFKSRFCVTARRTVDAVPINESRTCRSDSRVEFSSGAGGEETAVVDLLSNTGESQMCLPELQEVKKGALPKSDGVRDGAGSGPVGDSRSNVGYGPCDAHLEWDL